MIQVLYIGGSKVSLPDSLSKFAEKFHSVGAVGTLLAARSKLIGSLPNQPGFQKIPKSSKTWVNIYSELLRIFLVWATGLFSHWSRTLFVGGGLFSSRTFFDQSRTFFGQRRTFFDRSRTFFGRRRTFSKSYCSGKKSNSSGKKSNCNPKKVLDFGIFRWTWVLKSIYGAVDFGCSRSTININNISPFPAPNICKLRFSLL